MKLQGYWRSSASYRVRIALQLKSIEFESIAVDIAQYQGLQNHQEYKEHINPSALVPVWQEQDWLLHQSLAIIEYLDELYPQNRLLPENIQQKAYVRALAYDIACEIHPLNNFRVLQYLSNHLNAQPIDKAAWYEHWVTLGLTALEQRVARENAHFCFGETVTLADLCLIPQLYNAHRFNIDLSVFPTLKAIEAHCLSLPAFFNAMPEQQPDAKLQ